jgi:RNA polymerase sigma-70 factor (ECF subfamily)
VGHAANNIGVKFDASTWLEEHGDALYRYALVRVRDSSVAEDLVQETLLAAMQAADRFQGASSERTWLVGILRHKLLDFFRRTARERELEKDWTNSPLEGPQAFDDRGQWKAALGEWGSPEKSLVKIEFWRTFNNCMDALPEQLRTPFALRELEGLDTDAVIRTLAISSKNNLWVMLSRARQRIRSCLQSQWFEENE